MSKFLSNPRAIRRELLSRASEADAIDVAAAFVNWHWFSVFGDAAGPVRLVCWLRTTNTNPFAVEAIEQAGVDVRHLDRMHAKVYVFHSEVVRAVVGSANVSRSALEGRQQVETAVRIGGRTANATAAWFDELWAEASPITAADLEEAKSAFQRRPYSPEPEVIPDDEVLAEGLRELAASVEKVEFEMEEECRFVQGLDPATMDADDVQRVYEFLTKWCGRHYVFKPVLSVPIGRVRRAFSCGFDESLPLAARLGSVTRPRDLKLDGLAITSWTMLLEWRFPDHYPAFNRRTVRFLKDFRLRPDLVDVDLTVTRYLEWIEYCERLAESLGLRNPGLVDRMVWEHTRLLQL